MSINDIFWLFFMFTALQPLLRQRMLEAMRTRKIAQIERPAGHFKFLRVWSVKFLHPRGRT